MVSVPRTRKRAASTTVLQHDSSPPRKKQKRKSARPPTHTMRTRARAKILDIMSFPAEIRNNVYAHMYEQDDHVPLKDLRLPSSIRVPGMFSEALPVYFESTPVAISTRSNWCVRAAHLHTPHHIRYESTGKFEVSSTITRMPESVVRFRKVKFNISCCCCDEGKDIADMRIESTGQDISCTKNVSCADNFKDEKPTVIEGLEKMLDSAEELVNGIKIREGFNGFSIEDLRGIAMCFRDDSKNCAS